MVIVKKKDIGDVLLTEANSELQQIEEKIRYFQAKHQQDFRSFSKRIENKQDPVDKYDDYIEWKAYQKLLKETAHRIEELRNGNFKIAE